MKASSRLELYTPNDREELYDMLKEFALEVYGSSESFPDVDLFVNCHAVGLYVVKYKDKTIGFSSFMYNSYYGLRKATIANDYIYVRPRYRRSKAMHLIAIQSGRVAVQYGCNLEHYYAKDSGSRPFIGRMEGKLIYNAYEYDISIVEQEVHKIDKKVRIKND